MAVNNDSLIQSLLAKGVAPQNAPKMAAPWLSLAQNSSPMPASMQDGLASINQVNLSDLGQSEDQANALSARVSPTVKPPVPSQPMMSPAMAAAPKPMGGAPAPMAPRPQQNLIGQYKQALEADRPDGLIQEQDAIDAQKQSLADLKNAPKKIDFSPLLALADSWNGTNMAKGYTAPMNDDDRAKAIAALENQIATQSGKYSTDEMGMINSLINKKAGEDMMRQSHFGEQLASREAMAAQRQANNDTSIKQYTQRLDGASRIMDLINESDNGKVIQNGAMLGQLNAEIKNLETGSNSPGLEASEKTEMQSVKAQLERLSEKFTGNPEAAIPPAQLAQAKAEISALGGSYMRQIDNRFDYLQNGATPNQVPVFQAKKSVFQNQYGKQFGGWSANMAIPQAGPTPDQKKARLQELLKKAGQ